MHSLSRRPSASMIFDDKLAVRPPPRRFTSCVTTSPVEAPTHTICNRSLEALATPLASLSSPALPPPPPRRIFEDASQAYARPHAPVPHQSNCVMDKINLAQKLSLFTEHWSPKIVGELNGQQVSPWISLSTAQMGILPHCPPAFSPTQAQLKCLTTVGGGNGEH